MSTAIRHGDGWLLNGEKMWIGNADVADTAIAQVAEELGERPGMKQMGLVMKAASALAAGKADGSRVSKAVKDRL